jgi:hypothetical protein
MEKQPGQPERKQYKVDCEHQDAHHKAETAVASCHRIIVTFAVDVRKRITSGLRGLPTTGKIAIPQGRRTRTPQRPLDALRQTAQFSTLSPGIVPSSTARSFVTMAPASMVARPFRRLLPRVPSLSTLPSCAQGAVGVALLFAPEASPITRSSTPN